MELDKLAAAPLEQSAPSTKILLWSVMDKLSDGRRPISTERAGAGGSDPIKAVGDERSGGPGDREPWKAQASSPTVPFAHCPTHCPNRSGQPIGRLLKWQARLDDA